MTPNRQLMAATVKLGPARAPAVQVDTPQKLFDPRIWGNITGSSQKLAQQPDGRFLVLTGAEADGGSPLTVVLNWK